MSKKDAKFDRWFIRLIHNVKTETNLLEDLINILRGLGGVDEDMDTYWVDVISQASLPELPDLVTSTEFYEQIEYKIEYKILGSPEKLNKKRWDRFEKRLYNYSNSMVETRHLELSGDLFEDIRRMKQYVPKDLLYFKECHLIWREFQGFIKHAPELFNTHPYLLQDEFKI